jgi:hypothetical protein
LFVDASGNVGVGIGSPTATIHANRGSASDVYFRSSNSLATTSLGTAADGSTYVYNSAAYPIAFFTNATERLRITSTGNVGVGTSGPVGKLNVAGYSSADVAQDIQITRSSSGTGIQTGPNLTLSTGTSTDTIALQGTQGRFGIWNYASSSWVERFCVTGPGNVGIGTNAPSTTLDCRGVIATNDALYCYNSARDGLGIWYNPGGAGVNQLTARVNGGDRLTIDGSGRVGLGTSSPAEILHLGGSSAQNIRINGNTNAMYLGTVGDTTQVAVNRRPTDGTIPNSARGTAFINVNGLSTGGSIELATSTAANTGATTAVTIDSSQRVGVGTTSPDERLHIVGNFKGVDSSGRGVQIINGATPYIQALGTSNINDLQVLAQTIQFQTGTTYSTTERARIDSSGNFGIGTSNPIQKLQVAGSAIIGRNSADASNTDALFLHSRGANSNNNLEVGLAAVYHGPQPSDSALTISPKFWNGSSYVLTERVRVTAAGEVGIGTTSPGFTVHANRSTAVDTFYGSQNSLALSLFGTDSAGGTVVYNGSAYPIQFSTNGTERARIDSLGRLLVGTSSARANLFNSATSAGMQVEGTSNSTASALIARNSNDAAPPILFFAKSRGTTIGSNVVAANNDEVALLTFQGSDGTEFVEAASISAQIDGTPGANDMPGRLVFSTTADGASSPTERMRIDSAGALKTSTNGTYKFGTGTQELTHNDTTSTIHLAASNTSFTGDATSISTYRNTTNDTYKFLSCIRQGFAVALEIRDDGDVYNVNGTYGSLSDAKLKENIIDAQSQWDDIRQLRVRNYNFKPETNNSTHKQIGVIAQEIEDISPGLVNTVPDRDEDGNETGTVTKSVNYSVLYMKAVKALQEAMERIEALEQRLSDAGIA